MVAALRIVEEVGEIREKIEIIVAGIGAKLCCGVAVRPLAVELQTAACGVGAFIIAQPSEPPNRALADGAPCHLVGSVPTPVVVHPGDAEKITVGALKVFSHSIDAAIVIAGLPWAVLPGIFSAKRQSSGSQFDAVAGKSPRVVIFAEGDAGGALFEAVDQMIVCLARR